MYPSTHREFLVTYTCVSLSPALEDGVIPSYREFGWLDSLDGARAPLADIWDDPYETQAQLERFEEVLNKTNEDILTLDEDLGGEMMYQLSDPEATVCG